MDDKQIKEEILKGLDAIQPAPSRWYLEDIPNAYEKLDTILKEMEEEKLIKVDWIDKGAFKGSFKKCTITDLGREKLKIN